MRPGVALGLDFWPGHVDVLVIGSGPSAVALVERLRQTQPSLRIGVLERGEVLTTTNVRNFWTGDRSSFIEAYQSFIWDGDFAQRPGDPEGGGMMILALGGRGIVAGAHLPRFYATDFDAWPEGVWPIGEADLEEHYLLAEEARNVGFGETEGLAQNWAMSRLRGYSALPPPWAFDNLSSRSNRVSRGFDSSVARLWKVMCEDAVAGGGEIADRRLLVFTNSYATRLNCTDGRVSSVTALDVTGGRAQREVTLEADRFVLAASPIESARLLLNSGCGHGEDSVIGRYLAEHIYARVVFEIPARPSWRSSRADERISLVVPPPGVARHDRFHVDVEAWPSPTSDERVQVRLTGSAAIDPRRCNAVSIAERTDEFGVPIAAVRFAHSGDDIVRQERMRAFMAELAGELGCRVPVETVRVLAPGRSHHEAGTLRFGADDECATDVDGRLNGLANLFVADASVFPSVGVANPMLTVTALAYRLASKLAEET